MPLFEYRCIECDNVDELLRKSSDVKESELCSKCGGESNRRLTAPSGFKFNGAAFSASSAKNK